MAPETSPNPNRKIKRKRLHTGKGGRPRANLGDIQSLISNQTKQRYRKSVSDVTDFDGRSFMPDQPMMNKFLIKRQN